MEGIVYGAGGVLLENGRVLVITEDETDERYGKVAGMLSIPMGRIRDGESPRRTAEREFGEETGCLVVTTQYLQEFSLPPAGIVKIYLVEKKGGDIKKGALQPRWMPLKEFLSLAPGKVRPPSKEAVRLALLSRVFFKDDIS